MNKCKHIKSKSINYSNRYNLKNVRYIIPFLSKCLAFIMESIVKESKQTYLIVMNKRHSRRENTIIKSCLSYQNCLRVCYGDWMKNILNKSSCHSIVNIAYFLAIDKTFFYKQFYFLCIENRST